ncbi:MAG TPA: GNAT family N-acetyltransferase, partial [Phototrophicaceae bacterium]|nr:GNAT family N-acetyltransferase [Phototrophicaceae bacterium]
MLIRDDVLIRHFQWSDLPAITDLYNLCQEFDHLEGRATLEEMENEWRSPVFDPEHEYMVIYTPEGQLIAYAWTEKFVPSNRAFGGAYVHPDYRNQGLGTHLLRTTDAEYLARIGDQIDQETPIYVQRWTPESKQDAIDILKREGYQQVRTFYTMRIELDQPRQPVTLPEGFTLKPFNPETDAYAVYQAQQEAFRDHWGHPVDIPFEEWNIRLTEPNFDASLWFIAYEGNDIAGVSFCQMWGEDIPDLAWVG